MKKFDYEAYKAAEEAAVVRKFHELILKYLFGQQVKKIREERGMTREELAKAIGSNRSVISRLERGKGSLSLKMIARICVALEVNVRIELFPHFGSVAD